MNLLLWEAPLSPFAEKVKIALREKGIPFERRIPEGLGVGLGEAGFLAANPRSEAPALVDGHLTIFDSTIILEYIEDRFPQMPLRPTTAAARARARMIEEVCDTHYEAINWGLYELNYFNRGAGGAAETLHAAARRDLAILHGWLERQLSDDPWFGGDSFGLADLCVAPFIAGSGVHGILPAPDSLLGQWFARVSRRPSVAACFAESQKDIRILTGAAAALEQGLLRRHYRDHRLEWMIRSGGFDVVERGLAADNIRFTDLAVLEGQPKIAKD